MKKMLAALPPLEWLLLIDGIVAANNERTCDFHHIGCSITLLLARTSLGTGVLLSLPGTALDELAACLFSVPGEQI